MLRALVVLFTLAAITACGASAAAQRPIVFGVGGGNMVPWKVTIQPNGTVRVRGSATVKHRQILPATVRKLRRDVQQADLKSRQCKGTLPDVGSDYIRVGTSTVTVHGACEPRFTRVWNELAQAVGLRFG